MNINVIRLDIAKQIFHLVALDFNGNRVLKKALRRTKLLTYFANLTPCTIGIEGCASSHHWATVIDSCANNFLYSKRKNRTRRNT